MRMMQLAAYNVCKIFSSNKRSYEDSISNKTSKEERDNYYQEQKVKKKQMRQSIDQDQTAKNCCNP